MAEDPYIHEAQIGVGPSAKVYRAHDRFSGRTVRLKVLFAEHESLCCIDRDHLAGRMAALLAIRHPLVCRVIGLDVQAHDVAVVSEHAGGVNGWQLVHEQPLHPLEARQVARQLLQALQAGEKTRFPHGGIKPSNVFVSRDEAGELQVRLQDWGLAQSRHRQPVETLEFRAPELLEGGEPTLRSDFFSAAATVAALLTGQPLVSGTTSTQLASAWADFDAATVLGHCCESDCRLQQWLVQLLQLNPRQRPASAKAALAALEKVSATPLPWWASVLLFWYNAVVVAVLYEYLHWLFHRGN